MERVGFHAVMTCLNVLPNRRGVEIITSELTESHPWRRQISGLLTLHSSRYKMRAQLFSKASWNF
jgi:hypothetical protein